MTPNDLDGFVVFENMADILCVNVNPNYVRFTVDVLQTLGDPKFINIFFDDVRKRMAVKAADDSMMNVFRVRKYVIGESAIVRDKIFDLLKRNSVPAGYALRIQGYKSGDYIIFDLDRSRLIKYSTHIKKAEA